MKHLHFNMTINAKNSSMYGVVILCDYLLTLFDAKSRFRAAVGNRYPAAAKLYHEIQRAAEKLIRQFVFEGFSHKIMMMEIEMYFVTAKKVFLQFKSNYSRKSWILDWCFKRTQTVI